MPPHIAFVLSFLHILLAYGRPLSLTLEVRAAAGFIGERRPRLPVALPPPYRERGSAPPRPP